MHNKLIAICGMTGSGKSTVREYLVEKGFEYLHLGVTELVIKKYGYTNEQLERTERELLRKEKGMGVMAFVILDKIKELMLRGKSVVIDNMYSWSEYKVFKQEFKEEFVSIAVLANPELRYNRVLERMEESGRKYNSVEEIKNRDYAEIENIEKGGPIAMADYYIVNQEDTETLNNRIEGILNSIQKSN
jgi:dephospho-CoA kinase